MGANGAEGWLANTCAAIQALGARVKLSDPVCLVLPAQHTLIKFIDLPPVGPAQRAQILEFAAEQNIPYALAEVAWASVVLDQSKGQGAALLDAAKLELLDPLCAAAGVGRLGGVRHPAGSAGYARSLSTRAAQSKQVGLTAAFGG